MKIALVGYGKMGHVIEEIALERGHEIILKITIDNTADFNKARLSEADVAIEFTGPDSAFDNVMKCLEWGVPVVSGVTEPGPRAVIERVANERGAMLVQLGVDFRWHGGPWIAGAIYLPGVVRKLGFHPNRCTYTVRTAHDEWIHAVFPAAGGLPAVNLGGEIVERYPQRPFPRAAHEISQRTVL